MSVVTVLSAQITSLDATPPVRTTAGKGAAAKAQMVNGFCAITNGDSIASVYRIARIPSNAIVKRVTAESHGTLTTLTGDVTLYYSDETLDQTGSSVANTGQVVANLYATAKAMSTPDVPNDVTNQSAVYDNSKRNKEAWDAAGLSNDPGGNFDVVFKLTAAASLTTGATIGLMVEYVQPYV